MRIGIHSGDVTGGILRGTRSRLQLFGGKLLCTHSQACPYLEYVLSPSKTDCMNVTARIESTSLPNRIHLSQECAELVKTSGKANWLQMRNGKIALKGKGVRQTFWLRLSSQGGSEFSAHSYSSDYFTEADLDKKSSPADRLERLINWNTDKLMALLRQVMARRMSQSGKEKSSSTLPAAYHIVKEGKSLLEDVKEIVELPDFVAAASQVDPDNVKIPEMVKDELHGLVTEIAASYRANDFHNFEHASGTDVSFSCYWCFYCSCGTVHQENWPV